MTEEQENEEYNESESNELESNESESNYSEKKPRKIVIPGETIVSGLNYLPGEGTRRDGNNIVASRFGLEDESGRLIRVIPLSGIYMPRRGNVVLGQVLDVTFNGWIMDINAPYQSFLPLMECPRHFNKYDLTENIAIGDMVCCKVSSVKPRGVDLTIKSRGLGKIEEGMIIHINSNKVPRVIGKEGSMINLIKTDTNCDIIVGQNGVIWVKGNNVSDELFAKEAITYVTEKSFVEGLTDKMKEWLEKHKKK